MPLLMKLIRRVSALVGMPIILILWLLKPSFRVRVMENHHRLFGHLSLEPEKYLSARDANMELFEVDFAGEKDWKNIRDRDHVNLESTTLDLWTFGRKKDQSNTQLVKLWKRQLNWAPSFLVSMLLGANKLTGKKVISEYRFSTLVSVDQYLDRSDKHLSFTERELRAGWREFESLGLSRDTPYVCLIVRNQPQSDHALRNRVIDDFECAVSELVARGIAVVSMGSHNAAPLHVEHPLVCDYANSGKRNEFLDLFLLAHCKFAVSTLSGPDATCLAFRRNVLYIDIANYALCFSGTRLTTWTPAIIVDTATSTRLSLRQSFATGAGWFWRDSQFEERGYEILRSTPMEIKGYLIDMLQWVDHEKSNVPHDPQSQYRSTMTEAMGELGAKWHGEIRSRISEPFLTQNAEWFLE
jgi:putative glycosyltransferase (TIGR04372 family)